MFELNRTVAGVTKMFSSDEENMLRHVVMPLPGHRPVGDSSPRSSHVAGSGLAQLLDALGVAVLPTMPDARDEKEIVEALLELRPFVPAYNAQDPIAEAARAAVQSDHMLPPLRVLVEAGVVGRELADVLCVQAPQLWMGTIGRQLYVLGGEPLETLRVLEQKGLSEHELKELAQALDMTVTLRTSAVDLRTFARAMLGAICNGDDRPLQPLSILLKFGIVQVTDLDNHALKSVTTAAAFKLFQPGFDTFGVRMQREYLPAHRARTLRDAAAIQTVWAACGNERDLQEAGYRLLKRSIITGAIDHASRSCGEAVLSLLRDRYADPNPPQGLTFLARLIVDAGEISEAIRFEANPQREGPRMQAFYTLLEKLAASGWRLMGATCTTESIKGWRTQVQSSPHCLGALKSVLQAILPGSAREAEPAAAAQPSFLADCRWPLNAPADVDLLIKHAHTDEGVGPLLEALAVQLRYPFGISVFSALLLAVPVEQLGVRSRTLLAFPFAPTSLSNVQIELLRTLWTDPSSRRLLAEAVARCPDEATRHSFATSLVAVEIAVQWLDMLNPEIGLAVQSDPCYVDHEGRTALHYAATADLVRVLVACGVDPDCRDTSGMTALHSAIANGNASVVLALLEAQADPDASMPDGTDPLALAIDLYRNGQLHAFEVIVQGLWKARAARLAP